MSDDKRRGQRQMVCVLAHLERESTAKKRSALINDISATGAHLLTRDQVKVGEKVALELHLEDGQVVETSARVVRIIERTPEQASLWTMNVGVEFDSPVPQIVESAAKKR